MEIFNFAKPLAVQTLQDKYFSNIETKLLTSINRTPTPDVNNPINITFSFIYPVLDNNPIFFPVKLSTGGTYSDYINDIKHDAKGDRTPSTWDPIHP
jgi:hypothetical protein